MTFGYLYIISLFEEDRTKNMIDALYVVSEFQKKANKTSSSFSCQSSFVISSESWNSLPNSSDCFVVSAYYFQKIRLTR
jgi:hypothetical protein